MTNIKYYRIYFNYQTGTGLIKVHNNMIAYSRYNNEWIKETSSFTDIKKIYKLKPLTKEETFLELL